MKLVIDTNIVFSAVYRATSNPGRLLHAATSETLLLYAPDTVRDEIERVIVAKLEQTPMEAAGFAAGLPITWIGIDEYRPFLPDARAMIWDASDVPLVAVAILIGADIASGDKDFHPLALPLIRTWTPRALVEALGL